MSKDSVKKDIENSVNKKIDEAKKIRVIESYRDKLIKDAMQEAKERKTSAVSLFIFLILGAVLAYFFPENVTKYPVYLAVAILTLSALFYKTLFDFAGICVLFLGGFYSFIFYNANLNIEAISIFSF